MKKPFSAFRDLALLIILFFLLKTAWNDNISFLKAHRKSIIHELNRTFLDLIYTTKIQIHALQDHPSYGIDYKKELANLDERVSVIEDKYKTNSPGLAFLGPLGTTSIVLKEQDLEKKLLVITHEISKILHIEQESKSELSRDKTLKESLAHNKQIIKELIT